MAPVSTRNLPNAAVVSGLWLTVPGAKPGKDVYPASIRNLAKLFAVELTVTVAVPVPLLASIISPYTL